ncbi:hypothetical protein Afil01_05950 [Actinorhabdospora filicis]|uniref:DUF4037 domain-containing protein n=1 Tax=Actinorhabdospora filicis TaxID=1785913 RepID=A0A9W6W7B8_9ACTN|nr:DUF4037 domain-containing protein [Actinorhabdospora filicis]GLZ75788.1 hypothetical protein Afil01_05950 [Actinorhabdospora filicis]
MSGRELSRRFYEAAVRPLLGDFPHAAALLGEGSEVLGFDDGVSPDHDYGPRCQIFTDGPAPDLGGLPGTFDGFPVRFAYHGEEPRHRVEVIAPGEYFRARLGFDPANGVTLADWLLTPTQRLATFTEGAVHADPHGLLTGRRAALAWYPDDVWRYAIACSWLRISQEESFISRAGERGDALGGSVIAARLAGELMRLAFLVERRWAPYPKWFGSGFARLPIAAKLEPHLTAALTGAGWREREAGVCAAGSVLAAATNALELAEAVDPEPRPFFGRAGTVIGGERLTVPLLAAITDPELNALIDRFARPGRVGRLPGTIDQAVDSVEILAHAEACRAAAPLLGVPPQWTV